MNSDGDAAWPMPASLARGGDGEPRQSEASAARAELVRGMAAIDEHEWDALVADNDFFNSHRWLAGLDAALDAGRVLSLRGPAGLLAGCAMWDGESTPGLFHLADLFADLAGPWERPFLWLGGRRSTHNELACVAGAQRPASLRAMIDRAREQAQSRGCAGVIMPYMPLYAAREAAQAGDAQWVLHSAEAAIRVPPCGFDELMSHWNAHDRTRSKAELAAFAHHGNRVEWRRLDEADLAPAARLIAMNRARHGSTQGAPWTQRLLRGQLRCGALDAAIAAWALRGEQALAVSVFYRFGRALHARYFGSDYAVATNDFRYFVLNFNAAIDYAAAHGCDHYRLSTSALDAKVRRGARIEPLAALIALVDGSRWWTDRAGGRIALERGRAGASQPAVRRRTPAALRPAPQRRLAGRAALIPYRLERAVLHLVYLLHPTADARADMRGFWAWTREREQWFYRDLDMAFDPRWYVCTVGADVHAVEHWISFRDEAGWGAYRAAVTARGADPAWERRRIEQERWWVIASARLLDDAPIGRG